MSKLKFNNIFDIAENYDALLFDIWGVIIEDQMLYPGVVEAINRLSQNKEVRFVSNIPRPRDFTTNMLVNFGIKTKEEYVISSGEVVREIVSEQIQQKNDGKLEVFHLGQEKNKEILAGMDINLSNDIEKSDLFVMSIFADNADNLDQYDDLMKKAAKMKIPAICANPDTIMYYPTGERYCAGYFAAKFEKFGGNMRYIGKPKAEIFTNAINTVPGIEKDKILMIGDSFHTDILGANMAGIHSALVLTGNCMSFHAHLHDMQDKLVALEERSKVEKATPTIVIDI